MLPPPAHRVLLPTALLLVLALQACTSKQDKHDREKQLEIYETTANYLWQDGSLVRAQDQAVKALELDPKNVPMRRMIGWIRIHMGGTEDLIIAERIFRELYDEGDQETPVLLGLATVQERLGVAKQQAAEAIAAGRRTPEKGDPARRAKELEEDAREFLDRAHANYSRVLAGRTQRSKALNGLQRVDALRGRYADSLEWGRQLVATANADVRAWQRQLDQGDLTRSEEKVARGEIRAHLGLQVETHLVSSSMLQRLGRTGEALDHLNAATEIAPDRADLYSLRAQLRGEIGEYAEAVADLDRYLRLSAAPFEHPDVQRAYDLRKRYASKAAEVERTAE